MKVLRKKTEATIPINTEWIGDYKSGSQAIAVHLLATQLFRKGVEVELPNPANFHGQTGGSLIINGISVTVNGVIG